MIRLWDWPVRLVHWSMAALIPMMWWTAEEGELERHRQLGMVLLFLILFRLAWGFMGSETARFSSFVRGPRAIADYLAGRSAAPLGHNPLGALSVVALLGLVAGQLALGMVAQDEYGMVTGPLNFLVSAEVGEAATEIHEALFNGIITLVALHVAAILYYQFVKRDNLIGPMLSGRKAVNSSITEPRRAGFGALIGALVIAGALTSWIAWGAPPLGG
jgi:cytochrome b